MLITIANWAGGKPPAQLAYLEIIKMSFMGVLSLRNLLIGGLAVWAILCFTVHGISIIAYIGLQLSTTGLFAWDMHRIEKKSQQNNLEE